MKKSDLVTVPFLCLGAFGCAGEPEVDEGIVVEQAIEGERADSGVAASQQEGPWSLTIISPHTGLMPSSWTLAKSRGWTASPVWHMNTHVYKTVRGKKNELRNWHIVWCRIGGESCQPPPGKAICLYVWDSVTKGNEISSCFDDTRAAEEWVVRKTTELVRTVTEGGMVLIATGAVFVQMLLELFWSTSKLMTVVPLKPDTFTAVVGQPIGMPVLANDTVVVSDLPQV